MENLEYTVRQTICRYHMLQPGDQVVIALSGGADSVCLLSLLADMREEMGLKLRSLHVHHGLRGEEADRDGDFSIKISEALGVPCHMIKAEVKKYASQTGMSEEEAGRILRYKALEEEAGAWEGENGQTVKIAVAHHSRDQAETILLNLFRGSGLGGLKGIPYVRDRIIRPTSGYQRRNQSGSRGRNTPCRVSGRNGRCVSEKTGRSVGAKICKRGRAYLDDPGRTF